MTDKNNNGAPLTDAPKYDRYTLALGQSGLDADINAYLTNTLKERKMTFANYARELITRDKDNEFAKLFKDNVVVDKDILAKVDNIANDIRFLMTNPATKGDISGIILEKLILMENSFRNINVTSNLPVQNQSVMSIDVDLTEINSKLDDILMGNISLDIPSNAGEISALAAKIDAQSNQINLLNNTIQQLNVMIAQQQQLIQSLSLSNSSMAVPIVSNVTAIANNEEFDPDIIKEQQEIQERLNKDLEMTKTKKPGLGGLGKKTKQ